MSRRTAVVTIAHGRHEHLRRQVLSLRPARQERDAPIPHVVVAMADPELARMPWHGDVHVAAMPADPAALPLAAARNLGARRAIELGAETLVFLDVDCLAGAGLVAAYDRAVTRWPDTVWSGPVTYLPAGLSEAQLADPEDLDAPHPARPAPGPGEVMHGADPNLFWSLSFALDRDAWSRSGGFCERYVGYGAEDTDFGHQVTAAGLELGWVGGARAYHQFHPTQSPPVDHVLDIVRNGAIFHERWGRWPMEGWLEAFEQQGLVERAGGGWRARNPA